MKLIFSLPKCYNRYPRKATKYEQLNDKKRFRLISSRNRFLNCIFDFTKDKRLFQFYFQAEITYGVVRDRIEKPRHPAANVIIPVVLRQRKK